MFIWVKKSDIKIIDKTIKLYAETHGGYLKESNVIMRAMWNIITNNNEERKRSRKVIGDILSKIIKKLNT